MEPRAIRLLAAAPDGGAVASDGGRRVDRLDGAWFARWQRLPEGAQVVALAGFGDGVLACDAGNGVVWRVGPAGVTAYAGRPRDRSRLEPGGRRDGPSANTEFKSLTAMTVAGDAVLVAETGVAGPIVRTIRGDAVSTADVTGGLVRELGCVVAAADGVYALGASGVVPILLYMSSDGAVWRARVLAGNPQEPGSADGIGPAARFARPTALAAGAGGECYVADGARVRVAEADGAVRTLAGGAPGCADGANARFGRIAALCALKGDGLLIADPDNDAVRAVSAAGAVTTIAGGPDPRVLDDAERERRFSLIAAAGVDDDAAEAWALARGFLSDHAARGNDWPDRITQPVSIASARVGKDLAERWSQSDDAARAALGRYVQWLMFCEERAANADDVRDGRLRRLGAQLVRSANIRA